MLLTIHTREKPLASHTEPLCPKLEAPLDSKARMKEKSKLSTGCNLQAPRRPVHPLVDIKAKSNRWYISVASSDIGQQPYQKTIAYLQSHVDGDVSTTTRHAQHCTRNATHAWRTRTYLREISKPVSLSDGTKRFGPADQNIPRGLKQC